MRYRFSALRRMCAGLVLFAMQSTWPQARPSAPGAFPSPENLVYGVEWRLIAAGSARITLTRSPGEKSEWRSQLHLESTGLVSKLYKVNDEYSIQLADQFCTVNTDLDSFEGKRHHSTQVHFDGEHGKATYVERDLIKNSVFHSAETQIPSCVSDFIGGLYKLRALHIEPGQSAQLPVSDGKKFVSARVEAQEREQIQTKAGTFKTIRYEAYVFNGVLFKRNARLLVWLTDDARRLPVQIRARMSFPVGNITLQLEKEEHS
ncbi:MAG: DUF3108 domain-containing protein [Acidobacteriota bacterium]|nr:DUF3108 domain-containing protein [Acidobacteriota bacterium]